MLLMRYLRFLFSYLGIDKVPTSPPDRDETAPVLDQQIESIVNTVKIVMSEHPHKDTLFDAIGYLLGSRYAENRLLKCLHTNPDLQSAASMSI